MQPDETPKLNQNLGEVIQPGSAITPNNNEANPSLPPPEPSGPTFAPQTILPSGSGTIPPVSKSPRSKKKIFTLVAAAVLLIGSSSAAAYYGYIVPNKPENIWKTSLERTSKGYDKLTTYATSKKDFKGLQANGSFKISGSVAADGSFNGLSDGKNGKLTGSISAVGLKVNFDTRVIDSPGNSPDIYFKVDGIQDLGSLIGSYGADPQVAKAINGLNGQWYFVDHTLFDQFAKGSNSGVQFTSADFDSLFKAIGDSNKKYIFTSDPQNAAFVVKQNVGKETQDDRSVYHYKVGVNKTNLKAYNKDLCNNLIKSKLFKMFSGGSNGDEDFTKECNDTIGIDKIDSTRTADVWVDMHTKLINKVRFTDKKNSSDYLDLIQNYTGGDEFPFSVKFRSTTDYFNSGPSANNVKDTSSGTVNMKLNMKTNTFSIDATFENSGSSNDKATFKLTVSPSSSTVKVDKPAKSKTIIQLLNDLGLGDLVANPSSTQESSSDTKRRTDINAIASQLEVYYTDSGGYPVFNGQVNSDSWLKANFKGVDLNAFKAPNQNSNSLVLSATPTKDQYGYLPLQADGKTACTTAPCSRYILYWYSEKDKTVQSKDSLN